MIFRILKLGSAVFLGLLLYLLFVIVVDGERRTVASALASTTISKASGQTVTCPWSKLLTLLLSDLRLGLIQKRVRQDVSVIRTDERLGVEYIHTPTRSFWIKKAGGEFDGRGTLAYVLAEQEWISELSEGLGVRRGDVVVDVGAHVGTFGDNALRLGASRVIMIEPDPVNVECIRRNFANEISSGRVVLVPEGAWSKADVLKFNTGVANSGTGSFVLPEEGHSELQVSVRPLDDILQSIGIPEVQFIKMDIEGAEREALKGAARTLARHKPRLMLDMYHLTDDEFVLPRLITAANSSYRMTCTACSVARDAKANRVVPYATFFY